MRHNYTTGVRIVPFLDDARDRGIEMQGGLKGNREKKHLEHEKGIADLCSSARITERSSQKLTNGLKDF